jgi:hypothetical protein
MHVLITKLGLRWVASRPDHVPGLGWPYLVWLFHVIKKNIKCPGRRSHLFFQLSPTLKITVKSEFYTIDNSEARARARASSCSSSSSSSFSMMDNVLPFLVVFKTLKAFVPDNFSWYPKTSFFKKKIKIKIKFEVGLLFFNFEPNFFIPSKDILGRAFVLLKCVQFCKLYLLSEGLSF